MIERPLNVELFMIEVKTGESFVRSADHLLLRRILRWTASWRFGRVERLILFSFLAVASIIQAFGQSLQPDSGLISYGTVVNSVTHEPISRVLVHSVDNRFAMFTDSDGRFEFRLPEVRTDNGDGSANAFEINRMMAGNGSNFHLATVKPGFLEANRGMGTDVIPGRHVTIPLMPEAVIKGKVVLSTGDPAVGTNIQLFSRQAQDGLSRWVPGPITQANSNGEFRFAELAPGAYKVVTHELLDTDPITTMPGTQVYGFPPFYYPGVGDFESASPIALTAGETFEADISLARKPYYRVRIPVVSENGFNGVGVTVSAQGHRGPGYPLGYKAQAHTIEGLLPDGNYLIEGNTFTPNPESGAINIAIAGGPIEGPSMALTKSISIDVNVNEQFSSTNADDTGSWTDGKHTFRYHGPRLYLQIWAITVDEFAPERSGTIRPPSKQEDNSLVLDGLGLGRYLFRFSSSRGYVASATLGAVDLLHQAVTIGAGSVGPIEVTMRDDFAEVEGTLATSPDAGQEIARPGIVYCIPLPGSPGQFQQISSGPDGKFTQQMPPGVYHVLAFDTVQPDLLYRDPEAMRPYESMGEVVHLQGGQKQTVRLSLIPGSN